MSSIFSNTIISGSGRVLTNALGLVVLAILTRALGPEGFGAYSTVYAYLFFAAIIADLGIGTLLTREISRPGADEARITGALVSLRLIAAMIVTAVAVILAPLFGYGPLVIAGIAIIAIATVSQAIISSLMGVFQKHLRMTVVTVGDIVTRGVQLGGFAVLIRYGAATLIPVLWVNVAAEAVHLAIVIVAARRIIPFSFTIDWTYWRTMLRHALPIAASLVFTLLYFKIDTVMLSLMRSAEEVGVYAVAYKVLEVIIFFPAMYVGLVMPLLSRFASDPPQFRAVFVKAFWVLIAGAVATVIGLLLFASPIVRVIGGATFTSATPILQILSIAIGVIFLGNLGGNAIIALNLQKRGMFIYAAGAAFNVVTNLIFIPRAGAIAAAWTTVATELLVTAAMFWLIGGSWQKSRSG